MHVPFKRSISKRQHVPFMTPELLGSLRHRNKLRELYFKSKDPENWESNNDPEDVCWVWGKLLSDALDVHGPVKRSIYKRQHVPFMTPELLGSLLHRNKLRELYFKSKDPENWEKYILQRNLTSSLKRREISSYLWSRADSAKGDPKQFWYTIKPCMRCKRSNNEGTYRRKENSVLVTDKKKVAQIFNNYFSFIQNLGEEHDSNPYVVVDISVHPSIAAIRDECVVASQFEFNHVSMAETELVLLDEVFDRCVQKQLVHYFNPYLSKFLSAYRKGYSCESVSLHLIEDWKGALD